MTTAATLGDAPDGSVSVGGALTFDTVAALLPRARARVSGGAAVTLDLGAVERADSAGLALLVECLRSAREAGGDVRFSNVPAQILAIARTSRLDRRLFEHPAA